MYNSHSKYIGKQIGISILCLVINVLIFYYCYFWDDLFCVIPFVTLIVQLVFVFKERKKFDYKKPILRQILLILGLVVAALGVSLLDGNPVDESRVSLAGALCAGVTYSHLLLSLLSIAIVRVYEVKRLSKRNQVDELDPVDGTKSTIQHGKKLGIGYTSKKDFSLTITCLIASIVIFITLMIMFMPNETGVIEIVFAFFGFVFVYLIVFLVRIKFVNKPVREFEDTFDYPKLEKELFKVVNNPIVHDETRNYYKLLLANYIGLFSLEKRKEILDDMFVPSYPAYRLNYFMVQALEFNDDKEKLYECYQEMKNDPQLQLKNFQKLIDKLIRQAKIIFGDLETKNFDADFPIVYNSKLMHLNNKIAKLRYYYYRNDFDNVKLMADEINKFIEGIPLYPKENLKIDKYFEKEHS